VVDGRRGPKHGVVEVASKAVCHRGACSRENRVGLVGVVMARATEWTCMSVRGGREPVDLWEMASDGVVAVW
jgi:hypothetical protein